MVKRFSVRGAVLGAVFMLATGAAMANDLSRSGRLLVGQADWVTTDGASGAFGSGRHVYLTRGLDSPLVVGEMELTDPVRDAVLVGRDLYVNDGRMLRRVRLDKALPTSAAIALEPAPVGRLHTARMTDYIVVAEDGFGLRLIELPPSTEMLDAMGDRHHGSVDPRQVASVPIRLTFRALATAGDVVYAGTNENTVVAIEIGNIDNPRIRVIPTFQEVRAIAANGARLYVLGTAGLRSWDISDIDAPRELSFLPGVEGQDIQLLGRTLQIASGDDGLRMIFDASSVAGSTSVTVGNNFFSPQDITIDQGDQVTWSKQTAGFHNVEACSPGQGNGRCGSLTATQAFRSGAATTSTFTFSETFTEVGLHSYVCVIHAFGGTGMIGSVTVVGAPSGPPAVPDGRMGQPVTVSRTDPTGDLLQLTFDPATCSSTDHQIVFGGGSGLPSSLGGAFTSLGAACSIGGGPTFEWSSPATATDPSGLIWWIVLTTDGVRSEGSWGVDSSDSERNGAAASNQCRVTTKSLENSCGQ